MEWKFQNDMPLYLQIMEQMKREIAVGHLKPGDKIPSVRELAVEASVNPNTMQKALGELEREGILYSQRTAGRFVSEDKESTKFLQEELVVECMQTFKENMEKLGYDAIESVKVYKEYIEKKKE